MEADAVIAEIRQFRDDYAKRFNYDAQAILKHLREREPANGRKTVSRPPKRLVTADSTSER